MGLYSVFGGSPYINRFIDPNKTLKENIISTILKDTHPIYQYAEHLLITDFTNAINGERIFYAISSGKKKYGEIESKLKMKSNGLLSKQLATLTSMEIISKTYPINKPDDNKKISYEINDNLLRFYYAFIYKNKSALQVLGAETFYDEYIEEPIKRFISFRFEEICRSYFSLCVISGKLKGITNIGTFYYDDSVTKASGEFDVALQRKGTDTEFIYDVYEAKYYASALSQGEMYKEAEKIRRLKGLTIGKIGFIAISGYEKEDDEFHYITSEELYN